MTEISSNLPETGPDSLDDDTLFAELVGQTARIEWAELERFFAKGQILKIAPTLDLVDVAMAVVRDRAESVNAWQEAGQIDALDTDTARRWAAGEATLWAVVTPPWILVQESDEAPVRH
ncbi:DUF2288 domain-containing protein [Guyparkeria halophila]|uniref:DUF2288 domain-containing protein n=1 Tax=Guyparkeria halophila TaxID=47960 RepID=A0ABZ0YVF4_9GAMM|nr:DUF2288 domain-containing protein [Guyparkeria halophila]WQH15738.1 DUF2288 domain-containing protein [Guyparkeria halophila]